MTFLSKIELDNQSLDVVRDLADVHDLHRSIMRAFPQAEGGSARAEFGVLFRAEVAKHSSRVIVQSDVEPDWLQLPDGYLRNVHSKDIDGSLAACDDGRVLRFLLVANPTKRLGSAKGDQNQSRRVALTQRADQMEWLERRAEAAGFTLERPEETLRIDPAPWLVGKRRTKSERISVSPVKFRGVLRVQDHGRFVAAIRQGVGPAKAYGCGLLSLAPAD